MIKASEAMVKCLEMENTKVVFGYPGAAICPFYDALSKSDIRHILVRHEVNSGHSASGYARITGKPAVCIATSGPGATNLITAIATAYMDSIPLIIITGQVSTDQIGRDVFQEADITGAAEPFVKHSYLVKDANEIPRILKEAFFIAGSGRPGPVLIDIPVDVQNEEIDFTYPKTIEIRSYKPTVTGNKLQIKRICEALKKSKQPLICAGGGVFASNAGEGVTTLSEKCQIPVITTMMGISSVSTQYPLNFGMLGMMGTKAANYAVNECDLLILIGARVGNRAVKSPIKLQQTTKIIHIDIDPAEIGKNMAVDIPVVGDAKTILAQITEHITKSEHKQWIEKISSLVPLNTEFESQKNYINPQKLISTLSKKLPEDAVIVADVGLNQIWTASNFNVKNGRFLTSGGMGTMGYSIPAAIGAKLADDKRTVVAVCGDGSFQMQMMELATAVQHNVDIKIIIMKNNCLGMVSEFQHTNFNNNQTAVSLDGGPDFIMLAHAYGIEAAAITNDSDAEKAVDRLVASEGLFLLECNVNPEYGI